MACDRSSGRGPVVLFLVGTIALMTPPVSGADQGARAEARAASKPHWRSGPYCGVSATYALLRLAGADLPYDDVVARVPVAAQGSNLRDMKECLTRAGVAADVVRAIPSDLVRTPPPFIAHFERDERSSVDPAQRGHFVVVLAADERRVRYIDGATATIENREAEKFVRDWTGFLLVPRRSGTLGYWLRMGGFLAVGAAIFGMAWRARGAAWRVLANAASLIKKRRVPCARPDR